MSLNERGRGMAGGVLISRALGFCIYVTAFFLPACRQVGDGPGGALRGYTCAWMTLVNVLNPESWHTSLCLAIFSGWINPLILLYLIFLCFKGFRWPRRIVAAMIVLFIVGTWVFFSIAHLVPMIGHVLWIAGILMILAGEAIGGSKAGLEKAQQA